MVIVIVVIVVVVTLVWPGLLPRVGVECGERIVLATPLLNALLIKVPVVDEDLILARAAERAESKVAALGDAEGRRPGQVRWARVDELDRVVASVVKAGGDGARWQPSDLGVFDGSGDSVNV